MNSIGQIFIIIGMVFIIPGIGALSNRRVLILGKFPGDVAIIKPRFTLYFRLAALLLLSIQASLTFLSYFAQ